MSAPTFNPTRGFKVAPKKAVQPVEIIEDEVSRVLDSEFDPQPRAIESKPRAAEARAPRPIIFNTIEEVYPFIEGLEGFDFDAPRGLEEVPGKPWVNYQKVLLESIGVRVIPHDIYEVCGGKWTPEQRGCRSASDLREKILSFANTAWAIDITKPAPQFRLVDWKIVPITAPVQAKESEINLKPLQVEPASLVSTREYDDPMYRDLTFHPELSVPPSIEPGQLLPPARVTCCICRAMNPGMTPPPHDCRSFQA